MASTSTMHVAGKMHKKNHVAFSEKFERRSRSFGGVSMPNRIQMASSSSSSSLSKSSIASSVALPAPATYVPDAKASNSTRLSRVWRDLQGCNDWDGLLEPLHPLLRQEIIRYGEFVAACYEAFDLDPVSKRYLNCKYGKKNMLREVGMGNCGYEVSKYIYATPDINLPAITIGASCGRWIGYVAVSSDETVGHLGRRDIVITFRGTVTNREWLTNFMSSLTPARLDPHNPRPEVKVESGFLALYTSDESESKFGLESCRQQLLSEVSRLLKKYKGEEVSITMAGHSMGSALALLLAYDIAELGLNRTNSAKRDRVPITVFSYGGPRVGNSGFKSRCEELGVKTLRIVNVNDPITRIPGVLFNENFRVLGGRYELPWSCSCYAHVGAELNLDFFNMQNPSCVHDLKTYINLLKGTEELENQWDGAVLIHEARELLLRRTQNINMLLPWIFAATTMLQIVHAKVA